MQIAMLYSQLEDFERRSETLVRENECLLEESKNKCKKILEIYHRGSPEESLTLAYSTSMPTQTAF
jgi:flagellar motility protein MotE (MotC chaperone)